MKSRKNSTPEERTALARLAANARWKKAAARKRAEQEEAARVEEAIKADLLRVQRRIDDALKEGLEELKKKKAAKKGAK